MAKEWTTKHCSIWSSSSTDRRHTVDGSSEVILIEQIPQTEAHLLIIPYHHNVDSVDIYTNTVTVDELFGSL